MMEAKQAIPVFFETSSSSRHTQSERYRSVLEKLNADMVYTHHWTAWIHSVFLSFFLSFPLFSFDIDKVSNDRQRWRIIRWHIENLSRSIHITGMSRLILGWTDNDCANFSPTLTLSLSLSVSLCFLRAQLHHWLFRSITESLNQIMMLVFFFANWPLLRLLLILCWIYTSAKSSSTLFSLNCNLIDLVVVHTMKIEWFLFASSSPFEIE